MANQKVKRGLYSETNLYFVLCCIVSCVVSSIDVCLFDLIYYRNVE